MSQILVAVLPVGGGYVLCFIKMIQILIIPGPLRHLGLSCGEKGGLIAYSI
jgi:hypothetical protein